MPTGDQDAATWPGPPSVRVSGPLAGPDAAAVLDLCRQFPLPADRRPAPAALPPGTG